MTIPTIDANSSLTDVMGFFGSDKSTALGWHDYTDVYERLVGERKDWPLNILEVGIGSTDPSIPGHVAKSGASLRGWHHYFPNARIFGADIDPTVMIRGIDRISTVVVDQRSEASLQHLLQQFPGPFDLIVDDGVHETVATLTTMSNLLPALRPGGFYTVESVLDPNRLEIVLPAVANFHRCQWQVLRLPHPNNRVDNNMALLTKQ